MPPFLQAARNVSARAERRPSYSPNTRRCNCPVCRITPGRPMVGADIGDAAHQRLVAEDRAQHVVLLHAVLERDDPGLGPDDREELARRVLGVPELDAEHHHVDRADGRGIVGDGDLGQVDRIVRALDREAVPAHGREMAAARHEVHVGAALHQLGAEIAADAARPHDCNPHSFLPAVAAH